MIQSADRKKKVVVIGAGPAGMEAARVAGLRGHDVVLHERSNELGGGQLKLASVPPHKDVLRRLVDYYTACFKKLSNVEVILGKEVTAEEVVKGGADAVVLATGAEGLIPDVSGTDKGNWMTAHQVLSRQRTTGEVVIVVGGGSVGCEVANFLAQQGKMVTVVEMLDLVATDIHSMVRVGLLEELDKYGVEILTGVRFEALTEEGVEAVDRESRKVWLQADTIIFALGARAKDELAKDLKGRVKELHIIGDAKQPRRIRDAISEGYMAAYEI
jgi:pyruvate/2-oxoglutarate dehydrogenase complex dihydrolipoamide dehydrogenase (E3) component